MSKTISLRLTDEEYAIFEEKMKSTNLNKSDFVKKAFLNSNIVILDPEHKLYQELTQLIICVKQLKESNIKNTEFKEGVKEICMLLQNLLTKVNQILSN